MGVKRGNSPRISTSIFETGESLTSSQINLRPFLRDVAKVYLFICLFVYLLSDMDPKELYLAFSRKRKIYKNIILFKGNSQTSNGRCEKKIQKIMA